MRFLTPSRHGWGHFASATWRLSTSPIFCATVPEVLFGRVAAVVSPRSFFPLGPLDCALVASMVAPRLFATRRVRNHEILEMSRKHCVWGRGWRAARLSTPKPPLSSSLGTAPIYNTSPCQVDRSGAVPVGGRSYRNVDFGIAAPGTQPPPRTLSSSTSSCFIGVIAYSRRRIFSVLSLSYPPEVRQNIGVFSFHMC